jgi:hypothetical protein
MRHRLRLSLYDEYRVDAEVLDYLESLPDAHRSTFLQNLVRVGYQVLLKGAEVQAAYQQACLPDLKTQEPRRSAPAPAPQIPVGAPVPQVPVMPVAAPAPAAPIVPAVPEPVAPAPVEPLAPVPAPVVDVPAPAVDTPAPVMLFEEELTSTDPVAELLDADPAIHMAAEPEAMHDEPLMPDPVAPAGGGLDVMARMRAKAQGHS